MARRTSIMIDDDLDKELRLIQAKMIEQENITRIDTLLLAVQLYVDFENLSQECEQANGPLVSGGIDLEALV